MESFLNLILKKLQSYEFLLFIFIIFLLLVQVSQFYSIKFSIFLLIISSIFVLNRSGYRKYWAVLLLIYSSTNIYLFNISLSSFKEALNKHNLHEEPEAFIGKVLDDSSERQKGRSVFYIRGKFGFYDESIYIKVNTPDLPWRPESRIKKGDYAKCFLLLNKSAKNDLNYRLRSFWSETYSYFYLPADRGKEYYCRRINNSLSSSLGFAENLYLQLLSRNNVSNIGSGVLMGATMGRSEFVEPWVKELFKKVGLYHLLVVSGYHLGVILLLVSFIIEFITRSSPGLLFYAPKKKYLILLSWIGAILFILIGRMKSPILRAFIMMLVYSSSLLFERYVPVIRSMLYSLLIILLIWPVSILHPGVQLSYAALSGVILGVKFLDYVYSKYKNKSFNSVSLPGLESKSTHHKPGYFLKLFAASTGASIFITPIQWYWFGVITPYAVFYNVIFAPIFSIYVIGLGIFLIFCYSISLPGSLYLLEFHTKGVEELLNIIDYTGSLI